MKKFTSKSIVSINVTTDEGNVHVVFDAKTGGGSQYYCNDTLADALRKHYLFGVRFREEALPDAPEPVEEPKAEEAEAEQEEQTMAFACNDDAKDYFADKYGVSRSKMRTRSNIEDVARSHGIEIEWNDN
jgi:hypothetical protein